METLTTLTTAVWVAFFIGIVFGAVIGFCVAALFGLERDYDDDAIKRAYEFVKREGGSKSD